MKTDGGVNARVDFPAGSGTANFSGALSEQLFGRDIWDEPLQKFARATGLCIALYDEGAVCRSRCVASPIGERLERGGFWSAGGLGSQLDTRIVKESAQRAETVYHEELEMFAHLAVPIVIDSKALAVFAIGWIPDRFADPVACNRLSKSIEAPPMEVWQLMRMQQPISRDKLEMHARMLETLALPLIRQLMVQIEDRDRGRRARILNEAAHAMTRSAGEAELSACVLSTIRELVPSTSAAIEILNTKDISVEATTYADPSFNSKLRSELSAYHKSAVIPISGIQGQTIGSITLSIPEIFIPPDIMTDLQSLSAQFGTALQKVRLIQALENERSALKGANVQLQHLHKMKDEFLATVSHELRTPLNAIMGWAQILTEDELAPDEIRNGLDTIKRNAKNQSNLIEDLLDVSRIISGKMILKRESVEATALLKQSLETVRPMIEARKQKVHLQVSAKPIYLKGDATRITQIFWNLLSNASKFTPQGGDITVLLENAGHYFRLEVSDTGAGIAADFLPNLFNRFSQADGSYARRHGGLGLGLAIVRHLVELHGGTVTATSPGVGKGSTFTVFLPQNTTDQELDSAYALTKFLGQEPPKASTALRNVKVLLVDDEPDSLRLTRFVLEKCGAIVEMVDTAEQAFQKIRDWQPDILISDVSMPDETGYDLIRRIRFLKAEDGGNIPAVALTALASEEHRNLALNAGFQIHLAKPFEPNALTTAVLNLLKGVAPPPIH